MGSKERLRLIETRHDGGENNMTYFWKIKVHSTKVIYVRACVRACVRVCDPTHQNHE